MAQAAQAAAAAERLATKAASGVATLSVADDDGDDLDPNLYFERRLKTLDAAKAAGRYGFMLLYHTLARWQHWYLMPST